MQQFSSKEIADLKSRIDEIHNLLASRGDDGGMVELHHETISSLQTNRAQHVAAHLFCSVEARTLRKKYFHEMDISGAPWDMLLDLMAAERKGRELSASDLATGADVPLSSGLRILTALEKADLARRFTDRRDRRRSLVELTDKGREKMLSYFEKCAALWGSTQLKKS